MLDEVETNIFCSLIGFSADPDNEGHEFCGESAWRRVWFSALFQEHLWPQHPSRLAAALYFLDTAVPIIVFAPTDPCGLAGRHNRVSLVKKRLYLCVPAVSFFAFQHTFIFLYEPFFGTFSHGGICDDLSISTLPPFLCCATLPAASQTKPVQDVCNVYTLQLNMY